MTLQLGDVAPDFIAESTHGRIWFHQWIGASWAVLFSHSKDFTPVCTTELGYMARLQDEFDKRNVKIVGLSIDSVADHRKWIADIEEVTGCKPDYPLIGDPQLEIARRYGMLEAQSGGRAGTWSASDSATMRSVFVIGPDRTIKLMMSYPVSTGRNFDEILRSIDSLQLTVNKGVATPVNWRPGEDVIIVPTLTDSMARRRFPAGWRAPKPYLRLIACPR